MGLDIKIPMGAMFAILGLLLTIYGLATMGQEEMYQRSLDININLWTGAFMLVLGILMLATADFKRKAGE